VKGRDSRTQQTLGESGGQPVGEVYIVGEEKVFSSFDAENSSLERGRA